MSIIITTDTSTQQTSTFTSTGNYSGYINSNILQIQNYINSNSVANILVGYDTILLRNNSLSNYTTTSILTTLLSGK